MERMGDAEKAPHRPRVFGIGLNKTGTTSLHEALTILGYESLHGGRSDGPLIEESIRQASEAGLPLLSNVDQRWDAFSDLGVLSRRFRLLDQQYPGSHFVLTVRPVDAWVGSRRRHVERNLQLKARGEYDGTFVVVDEAKWRGEWDHHIGRVRAYFEGRDDFLEIDITATPEWGPLCRLLRLAEPSIPFPWENRDKVVHGGAARPSTTDRS
ncbi:MAG: sulfotransferase [Acidimicrobiales bacterium]